MDVRLAVDLGTTHTVAVIRRGGQRLGAGTPERYEPHLAAVVTAAREVLVLKADDLA